MNFATSILSSFYSRPAAIASCDVFSVCAVVNLLTAKLSEVRAHLHKSLQLSARLYTEWLAAHFGSTAGRTDTMTIPDFNLTLRSAAESRDFDSSDLSSGLGAVFGRAEVPESLRALTCPSALSWPTSLNDLSKCVEYIGSLVKTCEEEFAERWDIPNEEGALRQSRKLFYSEQLSSVNITPVP